MNTCRQPRATVGELSFSNYLIKGRCGIVQASNIGYKSVAITPEDKKHTLINCLGFSSHVYFPWKVGTITKTVFVSFNKVVYSLGDDCRALLSMYAFLRYYCLYSKWKARSQKLSIKGAQLSKIFLEPCQVWVLSPDLSKKICRNFYAVYIFQKR